MRPPGVGRDPPPAKAELNHTLGGSLKGEGPGHSPSLGVGRECLSPESHVKVPLDSLEVFNASWVACLFRNLMH